MPRQKTSDLLQAGLSGCSWIVSHQKPDGSLCNLEDGVGAYYKVPIVLSLAGRVHEAQRLAQWVGRHHFTQDGDFRAPQRKAREPVHERWPVYSNAWLIQGMHRLGRWDMSLRGMEFLLRYQVESGGFYSLDGEKRILEPVCTAWGGMAALTTGHQVEACRAGDLLARLTDDQPDARKFYYHMDIQGNVVTDVPSGNALHHFVDADHTNQIYYNPGIALIFLSHLHRATGRPSYLEACNRLFLFLQQCAEDVYCFPPSGKVGMGCALLHELTGNEAARDAALRVSEYLIETQAAEGYWRLPDVEPYHAMADRDSLEVRMDVTAEFSAFLLDIASRIETGK